MRGYPTPLVKDHPGRQDRTSAEHPAFKIFLMASAVRPADPADSQTRGSLLVIFLTVFIDLLGFGMVLPLLPIYASDFGLAEHGWQIGCLMASFSLMQFLFAPLWGRLSDRI